MTIKRVFRFVKLLPVIAVLCFGAENAVAQTEVTSTTLSAAVTASAQTITVASATNLTAGNYAYVDKELMAIISVSSTTATVRRGLAGGVTPGTMHASGVVVWLGAGDRFSASDVNGACTAGSELYLPHINTKTGNIYDCEQGYWLLRKTDPVNVREYTVRDSFDAGYLIMQDDGTAKSLTDAEENFVYGSPLGAIEYREELTKTASSWIIADGRLDISADDGATDAEGVEIIFGTGGGTDMGYIVAGTQGACIEASINDADINGSDFVVIGFRQNEAFVDAATPASYTLYNLVGIYNSEDGSIFHIETGATSDDSAVNWADGETRALKVCLSKAGVPSAYYSAAYTDSQTITQFPWYTVIPNVNNGTTITAGTQMMPFFTMLYGDDAANSNIRVNWVQLTRIP